MRGLAAAVVVAFGLALVTTKGVIAGVGRLRNNPAPLAAGPVGLSSGAASRRTGAEAPPVGAFDSVLKAAGARVARAHLARAAEGLTRTNETGGIVFLCFTPLLGMSEVVRRFVHEQSSDPAVINATIDNAQGTVKQTLPGDDTKHEINVGTSRLLSKAMHAPQSWEQACLSSPDHSSK
jgi:hypothetical protein